MHVLIKAVRIPESFFSPQIQHKEEIWEEESV